jgi:hypothetical protein
MPNLNDKELPDIHYGSSEEELDDDLSDVDESDDDDEVLKKTPKDVVDVLGFDPLELDE